MLERLTLIGFRSFNSQVSFANPVLFVGKNGSGKSSLVDSLAFLSDAMRRPLPAVVKSHGGLRVVAPWSSAGGLPSNLVLVAGLRDLDAETRHVRYSLDLCPKSQDKFEVVSESCVVSGRDGSPSYFDRIKGPYGLQSSGSGVDGFVPVKELDHLALPAVDRDSPFGVVRAFLSGMQVCRIEPQALRSLQDPDSGARLSPDGSNAASVLREIEAKDQEIMRELLAAVVPGTAGFRVKSIGPQLTIEFSQRRGEDTVRIPATNMSDGTLRLMGLLLAVFQRPAPTLLAVEEPEATMHPDAVGAITDVLRCASRDMQIVVTTHSPDVLDAEWIEDGHLRLVDAEQGFSRVRRVSGPTRQALKEHLMSAGELLRANALRPSPEPELATAADDNE